MNAKVRQNEAILQPPEHVLSTLEADGSRRWLKPKLSKGALWHRRQIVAYVLIAIFTIVPFLKINGKPLILLDIAKRQFTILGFTFLPTDTVLLAIFVIGILLSIFLFTALFGRVWCGWACPQTVYMEFVFRPIERLFDGTVGRGGHKKNVATWRTIAKYIVYFVLCVYLANTFLAYFVGVEELSRWVTQSPLEHPIPFAVMALTTFAMMVDFCFFREQMCIIACPYGRFQSVLLDPNSVVVAYDQQRGEPRGKLNHKQTLPVVGAELGDCIDCKKCVTTCPTGIDIRDGLQMECIHCTQCIDACNDVMKAVGRSPDLIRYSSQLRDRGLAAGLIRARTIVYPILLSAVVGLFLAVFLNSKTFDAVLMREIGNPFFVTDDHEIRNLLKLKVTNRTDEMMSFELATDSESVRLKLQEDRFSVSPRKAATFHISAFAAEKIFEDGRADLLLNLKNQHDVSRQLQFTLIGPSQ